MKITTQKERDIGHQTVSALQTGNMDSIKIKNTELKQKIKAVFPKMTAATPKGSTAKTQLVDAGVKNFFANGQKSRNVYLAYEVRDKKDQALIRIGLFDKGDGIEITDLYINPLDKPIRELNKFDFVGKNLPHYLVLLTAIAAFAVTIWALWTLFRTKEVRRKWLWAIGIIAGLGQIGINWTTGELVFQLVRIQFFSAFAIKPGFISPWIIGFSLPVFAIVFLVKARKLPKKSDKVTEAGM